MFRTTRSLAIVALTTFALSLGAANVRAVPIVWNNAAGGSWNTAGNWLPAQVPVAGDDASITLPGTYTVSATGALSVNSLVLGAVSGTQTLQLSSQTLTLGAASSVGSTGRVNVFNATIDGAGVLTNAGTISVTGALTMSATLATTSTSLIRVEGANATGHAALTVANGFTNSGAIELAGTPSGAGATLNVTAGTLVNAPLATISTLAGFGNGARTTLGAQLDNQGTVTLAGPMTLGRADAVHNNSGTISVSGDNLTVSQSGTSPTFTNTGTITIAASQTLAFSGGAFTNAVGGTLSGSGTLAVPAPVVFSNVGAITPGTPLGVLHITGPCPLTPTSSLTVELGGTELGTGYDQLAVSDAITVDGALHITLANGVAPAIGQSFSILTWTSSSGLFAITGLDLGAGLSLLPVYSATGITLFVVSTTWVHLIPASASPSARDAHVAASDPANNRMIVFGGRGNAGVLNDVWVLAHADGQGGDPVWTLLAPTGTPPSPRQNSAGAYDAVNNRLMVFGGDDGAGTPLALADVWVLTNANGLGGTPAWVPLSAAGGPGARSGAAAAYDAAGNQLIVFGGRAAPATCGSGLADVWTLSGANGLAPAAWTQLSPAGTPPSGRFAARAEYVPASNQLILTGGFSPCATVGSAETWLLASANGSGSPAWSVLATNAAGPSTRSRSAVYSATLNRMFAFGGDSSGVLANRVSALSGADGTAGPATWFNPQATSGPPEARTRHSAVASGARMIVFGGQGAASRLADVWVLEETQGRVLDVPIVGPGVPKHFATGFSRPPYPNPAPGVTRFAVGLAQDATVDLAVCDVAGRRVATLQHGLLGAGEHSFEWRGATDSGERSAPGLYFVRLEAGAFRATRKLVFTR